MTPVKWGLVAFLGCSATAMGVVVLWGLGLATALAAHGARACARAAPPKATGYHERAPRRQARRAVSPWMRWPSAAADEALQALADIAATDPELRAGRCSSPSRAASRIARPSCPTRSTTPRMKAMVGPGLDRTTARRRAATGSAARARGIRAQAVWGSAQHLDGGEVVLQAAAHFLVQIEGERFTNVRRRRRNAALRCATPISAGAPRRRS